MDLLMMLPLAAAALVALAEGTAGAGAGAEGGEGQAGSQPSGDGDPGKAGDDTQVAGKGTQTGDGEPEKPKPTPEPAGVELTAEQRAAVAAGKPLVLGDEQYSRSVQGRIAELNADRRKAREKIEEFEAARTEAERKAAEEEGRWKELYETEKTAREKEAGERVQQTRKSAFMIAATKAGVVDPDAAFKIADGTAVMDHLDFDDDGNPTGADEAVKALLEQKPYLASKQQRTEIGGPTSPPGAPPRTPAQNLGEAGDQFEQRAREL